MRQDVVLRLHSFAFLFCRNAGKGAIDFMGKHILTIAVILFTNTLSAQNYSWDSTLIIHKHRLTIQTKDAKGDKFLLVVKRHANSILVDSLDKEGAVDWEVSDFNKDGECDIRVINAYNGDHLYLFDTLTDRFRKVKGFGAYPEAKSVKAHAGFYYSYHRAGCADMNWVSDLFKIEDFRTIHIAQMDAEGCDSPYHVNVYKINGAGKSRVAKMPYERVFSYNGDKWEFIAAWWYKNCSKFE
jgi:hypothetical protein